MFAFALLIALVAAGPADTRQCIINCARNQFGKPYVWAAEGPDEFDCSGLVMYCYEQCGYYFDERPYTGSLIEMGHSVSESNLILADLVFPHSGHVQLYSGNGNIIHAPKSGDVVKEQAMYAFWAGRRLITGEEDSTPDGGNGGNDAAYVNSYVTIITGGLNMRTSPSTSASIIETTPNGNKIPYDEYIYAENMHWLAITLSGVRRYYCSRYVDGTCYTDPCAIKGSGSTTITTSLNIRDATSTASTVIDYASAGDVINYDVVFSSGGRTWISWVESSQRKYAVCKSGDGTTYCDPCPSA